MVFYCIGISCNMKQCVFLLYILIFFIIILGIILVIQDNKKELFVVGWNNPNSVYSTPNQQIAVVPTPAINYLTGSTTPMADVALLDTVSIQNKTPTTNNVPVGSDSNTKYSYNNLDIQYHDSSEDIQKQMGIDPSANLISVLDSSGNRVEMPISSTMNDTTYYEGKLRYDPTNYVPTYEDTIYFSKLTGLGYQTPIYGTDSQWGGFCSYHKNSPEKIEEKCGKLDNDSCATTACCVLLGGEKCVAGDQNGPKNKANYNDIHMKKRDKYFFGGKCYGNCVDDQSNYYNYNNEILTKNDKETHKLLLKTSPYDSTNINSPYTEWSGGPTTPTTSPVLPISPISPSTTPSTVPYGSTSIGSSCTIDSYGNLLDANKKIIANRTYLDTNNHFVDQNGKYVICSSDVAKRPNTNPV